MSDKGEPPEAGGEASGRFDFLQPKRDLQSNWEVDLAKNLEDYLVKICSGEISSEQSLNFAEAALLVQGSVQVYSRKVEYLYSLVLHALEFISNKRKDQEKECAKPDDSAPSVAIHEEDDLFLGLDNVPVDAKNCRDDDKIEISNHFVKAPTNLLVLEGDCLDSNGEANELESYLLATSDFYGDFLLLDPCDAGGIDSFLQNNACNKEQISNHKGASGRPKSHRDNVSKTPTGKSEGSIKTSQRKNQSFSVTETSGDDYTFEFDSQNELSVPTTNPSHPGNTCNAEGTHFGNAEESQDDLDEDEDPWKPLNPHEPGNLKERPFKKVRNLIKQVDPISKRKNQNSQFPLAKLNGVISPEFAESIEVKARLKEAQNASHSPVLYEKLRGSLSFGCQGSYDFFGLGAEDQDDVAVENELPDFDQDDYDMGMEPPSYGEKDTNDPTQNGVDGLDCSQNLEDRCSSHLDGLLAKIAETEKQTELAARVFTWKQNLEKTLEEQDNRPIFDIQHYGERILDKFSLEADDNVSMTFSDVAGGQPKHEVSRTFVALLQLVNNGNVDLQRPHSNRELVCYTAKKPFQIKLLNSGRRKVKVKTPATNKKRLLPPLHRANEAAPSLKPSRASDSLSAKLKTGSLIRHTADGKRRRRSGLAAKQLHSAADM